jgi:hypothetical protein
VRAPVVGQRDQVGAGFTGLEVDGRVPGLAPPVVGRAPDGADVDDQRVVDPALPRDARVGAQQHVGTPACTAVQAHAQLVVVQRLPQEVVDDQRRAVDHVDVHCVDGLAQLAGQLAHPGREVTTRVGQRVVVHELGEVVVALVGVAAAAVGVAAPDGHVVVARDALDATLGEQRPHRVALRSKAPQVPQAEEALASTGTGVIQACRQRVGVRIRPAEDPDPRHRPGG